MKNLYLIIGPSGSGKTELAKRLTEDCSMNSVESYTTRPPRYPSEEGHIFITDEEFDQLGEMCAYTEYNGYRYGVTKDILDVSDVYVIDPAGAIYLANHYSGKPVRYIWLGTSPWVCYDRMIARGDNVAMAWTRLEYDKDAFGTTQLLAVRSKMPGYFFMTDTHSQEEVFDLVKNKIIDFEEESD